MERKNAWETYDKSQEKKVMKLAEQYRQFISSGKTERECVRLTEKMAREAGYIPDRYRTAGERYEYTWCAY